MADDRLIFGGGRKDEDGIIPVAGEAIGNPEDYQQDRIFVYLRSSGHYEQQAEKLGIANFPVITLPFQSEYDLGREFYCWEISTAIAGSILGGNGLDD